jgi:hypothetical protein
MHVIKKKHHYKKKKKHPHPHASREKDRRGQRKRKGEKREPDRRGERNGRLPLKSDPLSPPARLADNRVPGPHKAGAGPHSARTINSAIEDRAKCYRYPQSYVCTPFVPNKHTHAAHFARS